MAHLHQRSPWTADRHKKKSKTSPPGKLPEVAEEQVDGHAGVCSSQGQHKASSGLPTGLPLQAADLRPCSPAGCSSVAELTERLLQCLPVEFDLHLPCAACETQLDTRFSADDMSERFSGFRDARTFAESASEHPLSQVVCQQLCLTFPCLIALASPAE